MHAYDMFEQLRANIGETSAGHWTNTELLRALNIAHKKVGILVQSENEDWLMKKSSSLTPVASVVTLPSDCAKPAYIELVSTGEEIPLQGTVRERRMSRQNTDGLNYGWTSAYMLGNTIEINSDDFTDAVYVWYVQRLLDLSAGTPAAGGAQSLTLADGGHSPTDDYYNNLAIKILTAAAGWAEDTISDYDGGTRVCVVTGTFTGATAYGTVSPLPEETHGLVVVEATLMAMSKPGSRLRQDAFKYWTSERRELRRDVEGWLSSRMATSRRVRLTEII